MNSKNKVIHIRINPQLKQETEIILDELGISLSQAISIYFKQIVMTGSIPFNLKVSQDRIKKIESEHKSITVDEIFREMGL